MNELQRAKLQWATEPKYCRCCSTKLVLGERCALLFAPDLLELDLNARTILVCGPCWDTKIRPLLAPH